MASVYSNHYKSVPSPTLKKSFFSQNQDEEEQCRSINSEHSGTDLRQTLSEHHVNMIAFSASVGFGLFLQSGRVIYLAGPGLAVFAYFLMGTIMWSATASIGEMTALFPVKGPIFEFPRRFLDESFGYATGWMTWFSWAVLTAAELVAISHLFDFRFDPKKLEHAGYPEPTLEWSTYGTSPAVWIGLFAVVFLVANMLPVRLFGHIEYVMGCLKMFMFVILILLNIIISARQPVPRSSHFWTYETPYSGAAQNITLPDDHTVITGAGGRLGAMWEAMTTALFGMVGFETVSLTAAENKDLRKDETVKIGTRKIALRVILLYTLATFVVGLNVPYTDENIRDTSLNGLIKGEKSAFIVSTMLNHYRTWPHFLNGFFIFSVVSCGINTLYNASRVLHALASVEAAWPDWAPIQSLRSRLERTKNGVPIGAVIASWLVTFIAFSAADPGSAKVLGRLIRCVVISTLLIYGAACASYIQFYCCIKAAARGENQAIENDENILQAYDREHKQYPYKSRGQWLRATYGLVGCCVMIFFNGWRSLAGPISVPDFMASYISIILFVFFNIVYQIKFHGFYPLNWRRRASMELQNPTPIVVLSKTRRGVLRLADKNQYFTPNNARRVIEWIWMWLR